MIVGLALFKWLLKCLQKRLVPKIKGAVGEWGVNLALSRRLDPKHYVVLDNLLLPDGHGGLTQIDHVVLSPFGVFVIETKNWDCWIFGSEKSREWTLSYRGGVKKRTMNPLAQNALHVRVIYELLNIEPRHVHNLVSLGDGATLKAGPIPGVVQSGMVNHILSFQTAVFPREWLVDAEAQIRQTSQSHDKRSVKLHLEQVKAKKSRC